MDFVIAGVTVNPIFLIALGFVVGVLGGFFGVGGGFLAAPFMFWIGVPMNFVVGTDLAHMTGKSIVAFRRHRAMGNVDIKLGFLMVFGTVVGVEVGALIVEFLERNALADQVIGWTYVIILSLISIFTAIESLRAIRMIQEDSLEVRDVIGFHGAAKRIQSIQIPPMISLPGSGIQSISLWSVLMVGFVSGLLAGMLGVGGGFIRMPMLVYVLGVPTHVAVGTDLFEIMFSAGYGTITHAIKGNVDVMMALVMQTGAVLGAHIGATSTRFFNGPRIRLMFSLLPFIGVVLVLIRLLSSGMNHW
jgi:hypothetical protein